MTLYAGTDVAFSNLCPACSSKALAVESRYADRLQLSLQGTAVIARPPVCEACEERELARRFTADAQKQDGKLETGDGRAVQQLPVRSRPFWGFDSIQLDDVLAKEKP